MKAILRSINNFSCKLKQSNNLKYNISPKIRSNKFKNISGNGNVTIEDAIKRNLKDYKIYGNTYQNSTGGKNLLNPKLKSNGDRGITGEYNNETFEITITGTPTAIFANIGSNVNFETPLPIGTYTISIPEIKEFRIGIHLFKSNGDIGNYAIASNKKELQITVSDEITGYYLYIYGLDTSKQYNDKFKVMFETGSTATEFEPYTGGQPSPNPDYPEEIISCGDRTKNLFDKTKVTNGYYIDSNGDLVSHSSFAYSDYIQIIENTIYSYSGSTGLENYARKCAWYDSSKNLIRVDNFGNSGQLTSPYNAKYFRTTVRILPAETQDADIDTYQLEESSTVTSYEPYGYKIPVNVRSDNLLNNTFQTTIVNGVTVTKNLDGSITANGTATANIYLDIGKFIQKQEIAYTLTGCPEGGGSSKYRLYILGETNPYYDNGNGANFPIINVDKERTVRLAIYKERTVENLKFYPMVRLTEIQNVKYQPYYNQTTNIYLDEPLRKIAGYSDYIDFINSKVIRNIGEIIFDGTESRWSYYTTTNKPVFYISYVNTDWFYNRTDIWACYCNYYKGKNIVSSFDDAYNHGNNSITFRTQYPRIVIRDDSKTSLDDFKIWLQTHNLIVDCVLATPTEENIELPNINLIEGKNTITIGTEVQGIFEVEYYSKEIIDISDYKYNLRKVED